MSELLDRAIKGDELSIARLLTKIEYVDPQGLMALEELSKRAGKAFTIGITGIPGAGKSTIIGALIEEYLKRGHKVGVVMIDPSSPFTKGSFMGNRIRMQEKTMLDNVFIRSLASRGHLGGVSAEALMLIEALDGLGFDRIIVETVGAGQTDTEIVSSVHSIAVLTVPGTGDEIQALKAGIMEIGDFYVINKADRPEAEASYISIKFAIDSAEINFRDGWKPLVLKTIATKGEGIKELVDTFEEHRSFLESKGIFSKRILERKSKMIELIVRREIEQLLQKSMEERKEELIKLPLMNAVYSLRAELLKKMNK